MSGDSAVPAPPTRIADHLWRFEDGCAVYLVVVEGRGVAIDFGSGNWLDALPSLGIEGIDHVFLTHHHADGVSGLRHDARRALLGGAVVHAPSDERRFLDPELSREFSRPGAHLMKGCPESYSVLPGGVSGLRYDMEPFGDLFWETRRIRFLSTPGHGPAACTVVLDSGGRQVAFCGDAAYAGGKVFEPYHLEWDHWTGAGVLAAWEGVQRLAGIRCDLLCPSHGPVIEDAPTDLSVLSDRLMELYRVKGQISRDEPDDYVAPTRVCPKWRQYLPRLFQFGANGYLLVSEEGGCLVVDPTLPDMDALEQLLTTEHLPAPSVACVTHYHSDHCDALPYLQSRYSTRAVLHPIVAAALENPELPLPWMPGVEIQPDELWPQEGTWRWREYEFAVAPWPGQTWHHCLFMTRIGSTRVAFCGDSFQPPSRWNGTGGFCAYNRSRFSEGFVPSARLLASWAPEIMASGHGTVCRFRPSRMAGIEQWAGAAEEAIRALCPGGVLEGNYYFDAP